jgi:hypothetical protein
MNVDQGGNLPAPQEAASQTSSARLPRQPIVRAVLFAIREALGILVWVYIVTKLFLFDIDRYLFGLYMPSYIWLLDYRVLFLLGIAGVVFLLCRRIGTVGSLLYILFYPIVLVFWRLPAALWQQKSWNITFHVINGIFSFLDPVDGFNQHQPAGKTDDG